MAQPGHIDQIKQVNTGRVYDSSISLARFLVSIYQN